MAGRALRAVTFLAPNQQAVLAFVVGYLGKKLNCETQLAVGSSYQDLYDYDLSFICGLPYVLRTSPREHPSRIEAIAAPVLKGDRFQSRPIYFSDVIVRRDSPFRSFADLRGCCWAYNEPESQSGYGITRYTLLQMGATDGFFGRVVRAFYHQQAIRMVCDGQVDAAAIDCQVLEIELGERPELAAHLRIIDSLGPSTIQPIAAAASMPQSLKDEIRHILAEMHTDSVATEQLGRACIDHYAAVTDSDYDDIRAMLESV
jgi:phosphonate transport system substrate-binding protein